MFPFHLHSFVLITKPLIVLEFVTNAAILTGLIPFDITSHFINLEEKHEIDS